ncbi:MAG: gfo/Idh/MocA family oxidoreductase [Clostridiales bacterium]|nr:MAG: gfo/Idh/MocA family oxidoreductase [Clostridiales bacterium]
MIRVGIIGLGGISHVHRKSYRRLMEEGAAISLEAFCDLLPERTVDLGGRAYTEIETFLREERGRLDMVDICLPTYLHAETAVRALESGFHVLVEKPMALNHADALRMCRAAERSGKTLMVAQCLRFSQEIEAVRRYLASGVFGAFKTADVRRDFGRLNVPEGYWFLKEECSGGALLDVHVHDIDWMQSVFGVPEALSTGASKVIPGDGYDIVSTNYYYKGGAFAHCSGEWTTDHNPYASVQQLVKFEKGYLLHTSFGGERVFRAVSEDGTVTELAPEQPVDMYYEEIRYFTECVAAGLPVARCTPESTAESIRIAMAEIASADAKGERIAL